MPFALATSRFIRLKNWDRTTINLPFGRAAAVGIDVIYVPPDADAETMEKLRAQVEATLNEATRRAYAQVGRSDVDRPEVDRLEVGTPEVGRPEQAGHG